MADNRKNYESQVQQRKQTDLEEDSEEDSEGDGLMLFDGPMFPEEL